jgi:hypothetical protein
MNFRTLVGHCVSGKITRRIGRNVTGLFSTRGWLRGVDLNHRPLGYEANRINDSIAFQRLDAAGNDTKSLERQESTVIGPQSDHTRIAFSKLWSAAFSECV